MRPRERYEVEHHPDLPHPWLVARTLAVGTTGTRPIETIASYLTREQAEARAKLENHPNDRAAIERLAGDIDKAEGVE